MLVLLLTIVIALLFYYYAIRPMKYWEKRGVEQGNPKWLFGHYFRNFIGKENGVEVLDKVYKQSPEARYTGMYRFCNPVLMVRDPDLIWEIVVKKFEFFMDHSQLVPPESDPLWSKNLLSLTGTKWRDARAHLSPSFTSSKMRNMFVLMKECAENLVGYLLEKNEDVVTEEMRNIFSRYTNDVIATTSFGIKVDSLTQPNNEFYRMANEVASFGTFWKTLKILSYWCIPYIRYLVKVQLVSDEAGNYFRRIIDEAIETREKISTSRRDMLHLLLEARKKALDQANKSSNDGNNSNSAQDISNEDVTAHAVIFISAGFESVSSFISFTSYELAVNPDIQHKLREEVQTTLKQCDEELTYEALLDMKYMDMVLSEALRKWPHFAALDRICTKSCTIHPVSSNEKPVHIETGSYLIVPIFAIHHDPKHFPDPERFDPERFSDERKRDIKPCTYFPFGLGPRNCIGSRFTLLEAKIVLFYLLAQFEIVPVAKTAVPLKFSKNTIINLIPEGGFWLGFKRIRKGEEERM